MLDESELVDNLLQACLSVLKHIRYGLTNELESESEFLQRLASYITAYSLSSDTERLLRNFHWDGERFVQPFSPAVMASMFNRHGKHLRQYKKVMQDGVKRFVTWWILFGTGCGKAGNFSVDETENIEDKIESVWDNLNTDETTKISFFVRYKDTNGDIACLTIERNEEYYAQRQLEKSRQYAKELRETIEFPDASSLSEYLQLPVEQRREHVENVLKEQQEAKEQSEKVQASLAMFKTVQALGFKARELVDDEQQQHQHKAPQQQPTSCMFCRMAKTVKDGYCLHHEKTLHYVTRNGFGKGIGKCTSCGSTDIHLIPYNIKYPKESGYIPIRLHVVSGLSPNEYQFLYCPYCLIKRQQPLDNDIYKAICDYRWKCNRPGLEEGDDLYWNAMHGDIEEMVVRLKAGWNPRYMKDLPMRWATTNNHVGIAILLFLHGSTDFSWVPQDKCSHPDNEICCHRLATYSPKFICQLALLHHVGMSSVSQSYSDAVRQHIFNMVCIYAKMHNYVCMLQEAKIMTQHYDFLKDCFEQYESTDIYRIKKIDSIESPTYEGVIEQAEKPKRPARSCPDGFILEQVPADGDCFFHCFVKGLAERGKTFSVQELRDIAAKEILDSEELFQDLVEDWKVLGVIKHDETIPQSLAAARIIGGKEWASNIIIHILSNKFKIKVKIHRQLDDGTWEIWSFPYDWKENVEKDITDHMDVVLHWWEHFDYLRKKEDESAQPSRTLKEDRLAYAQQIKHRRTEERCQSTLTWENTKYENVVSISKDKGRLIIVYKAKGGYYGFVVDPSETAQFYKDNKHAFDSEFVEKVKSVDSQYKITFGNNSNSEWSRAECIKKKTELNDLLWDLVVNSQPNSETRENEPQKPEQEQRHKEEEEVVEAIVDLPPPRTNILHSIVPIGSAYKPHNRAQVIHYDFDIPDDCGPEQLEAHIERYCANTSISSIMLHVTSIKEAAWSADVLEKLLHQWKQCKGGINLFTLGMVDKEFRHSQLLWGGTDIYYIRPCPKRMSKAGEQLFSIFAESQKIVRQPDAKITSVKISSPRQVEKKIDPIEKVEKKEEDKDTLFYNMDYGGGFTWKAQSLPKSDFNMRQLREWFTTAHPTILKDTAAIRFYTTKDATVRKEITDDWLTAANNSNRDNPIWVELAKSNKPKYVTRPVNLLPDVQKGSQTQQVALTPYDDKSFCENQLKGWEKSESSCVNVAIGWWKMHLERSKRSAKV